MGHGSRGRRLLVWDAPDMDHTLTDVISERASSATRPQMTEIFKWFAAQSHEDHTNEACVFGTIPPKHEAAMTAWVVSLRHSGFYVFVRPSTLSRRQATVDMMSHVAKRVQQGGLKTLYLATHDADATSELLHEVAEKGVEIVVLGYRERSPFVGRKPKVDFVDLEDIEGAFSQPLPRTNLFDLHAAGQWFAPLSHPEVERAPIERHRPSDATDQPQPTEEVTEPADEHDNTVVDLTALERPDNDVSVGWVDPNEVIEFVRQLVFDAAIQESAVLISDVGGELRRQFPGFTVARAGFDSVLELLEATQKEGDIELEVCENGRHRLLAPHPELESIEDLDDSEGIDDFTSLATLQPDITASFTDATTMSTAQ